MPVSDATLFVAGLAFGAVGLGVSAGKSRAAFDAGVRVGRWCMELAKGEVSADAGTGPFSGPLTGDPS